MAMLETPFRTITFSVCVSSASQERQISTLLYCLGQDAKEVLVSTGITTEERKQYDDVVAKLDQFFKVRKNTIFERARFNHRNQLEGESDEQYITVLFGLADNCDYGDFKSQTIRDRLVVGIRDNALSESLQMKVRKSYEIQREAVHEQQTLLNGRSQNSSQETWTH